MVLGSLSWPIVSRIPLGGDLAISPHGIGIAAGFLLGAWLMTQRSRKRGLGHRYVPDIPEAIQQLLGRIAIGAILGARFFYVLTHLDTYADDPLAALAIWEGGLTFLGGVAGAVIVAMPWAIRQGWRPLQLLDSAMPGLAAGLVVGRLGDLAIGDHIGAPTTFALGWRCTGNYNPPGGANTISYAPPRSYDAAVQQLGDQPTIGCFDTAVHQTALYDFGAALVVLVLLLVLERRARFDGFFAVVGVYTYGVVRFVGDFARQDRRFLELTGSQWALVGAVVAVTIWLVRTRPWEATPWAWDRRFEHPWLYPPGDTGEDARPDVDEPTGATARAGADDDRARAGRGDDRTDPPG